MVLWAYITAHGLHNAGNARELLCDANLRALFLLDREVDRVYISDVMSLVQRHLFGPVVNV